MLLAVIVLDGAVVDLLAGVVADRPGGRGLKANVDVAGHTVIETDANSRMVTNWTVTPAGPGSARRSRSSRRGRAPAASAGFFEQTFAPFGLRKIQGEMLENLKKQVEGRSAARHRTPRIRRPGGPQFRGSPRYRHHRVGAESDGFFMLPSSRD